MGTTRRRGGWREVMVAQEVLVRDEIARDVRYFRVKRILDVVLTILALIPVSVIMLITAILIRIDSPGPVIFKQTRFGLNGAKFTFYKFRSMYHNASSTPHEEAIVTWMNGTDAIN